jgi:hypothetical protein
MDTVSSPSQWAAKANQMDATQAPGHFELFLGLSFSLSPRYVPISRGREPSVPEPSSGTLNQLYESVLLIML